MGMDDHNAIDLRENALFLPASRSLAARAAVGPRGSRRFGKSPQSVDVHTAPCCCSSEFAGWNVVTNTSKTGL